METLDVELLHKSLYILRKLRQQQHVYNAVRTKHCMSEITFMCLM